MPYNVTVTKESICYFPPYSVSMKAYCLLLPCSSLSSSSLHPSFSPPSSLSYPLLSQVIEITEIVFSGVPKKHHLNCGFSIIAFHPTTQQQQSINLLAETPEDMRYWVHALRYIKAYWSKMQVSPELVPVNETTKVGPELYVNRK